MLCWQRVYPFWSMAFYAEFPGRFFLHTKKAIVVIIVGKRRRCLVRGIKENGKNRYGYN